MIASFSRNKTEILIALLFARQNEGPVSEGKPFKYIICGSPSTLLQWLPNKDNNRKRDQQRNISII
jgi:hypothetical protein